ncbi:MAG: hypothetical protein ACERJ1_16565 [Halodesulfovibrio sp.]|uniref:hypothetical protein n=1 Tax=Halodesulfovibrio sp. TaxID=1912772 RepID=UPI00359DE641
MKTLLRLSLLLLLVGCASPQFNYYPPEFLTEVPKKNSTTTAYVGDTLVEQKLFVKHDAIKINTPVKISFSSYTIPVGTYLKVGTEKSKNADAYAIKNTDGENIILGSFVDPAITILAYKNENKICVVRANGAYHCTDAEFTRTIVSYLGESSFQHSLLYSGKVGEKLNISYREFSNNHARPAFTHNVEYDLNESKIIGYKGALIEIINATNNQVKYKVLRNFKGE